MEVRHPLGTALPPFPAFRPNIQLGCVPLRKALELLHRLDLLPPQQLHQRLLELQQTSRLLRPLHHPHRCGCGGGFELVLAVEFDLVSLFEDLVDRGLAHVVLSGDLRLHAVLPTGDHLALLHALDDAVLLRHAQVTVLLRHL
eukprot:CAMPEP_0173346536 /NCGR_PEP_ID=MMETSP1144-20121109/12617_1 /TAXON_ID=483371 /ORGANISM="non described non described, Strain CCMP2298" /LENGTH=142 /DNA_ID=CAMNT_0014293851 /DNA_START=208 /DNA_END=632 /DNA_ORIENTATION=-